jgi:hypothetical protein
MPAFHEVTRASDVWFEAGMVYFDDPESTEGEVCSCTVKDFAARIAGLRAMAESEHFGNKFACGRVRLFRFLEEAEEFVKECGGQLHVGLSVDVISDVERSRRPISQNIGFGESGYSERPSGLLIPN